MVEVAFLIVRTSDIGSNCVLFVHSLSLCCLDMDNFAKSIDDDDVFVFVASVVVNNIVVCMMQSIF